MSFVSLIVKPLAYFGLPSYLLHRLSQSSPLTRYYLCNVLYVCTIAFCSSLAFCSALPLYLLGRRYDVNFVAARSFYTIFSTLSGLRIVVEGKEHLQVRPCVMIGNHQSMLDIHFLAGMFPTGARMMAKKSLKYIPIFGTYLQASGSVFIDRGNSAAAVESLRAAGEEIKKSHTSLWIFPEGTRTSRPYHDVRPFKKGAFHLAIRAGLPLVPVVVENYWNLYHNGVFNSGTFKVRVLPPISTDGLTTADVGDFSARVRAQMLQVLHEISDPNAPPPPATPPEETISLSQTKDTPSAETPSNVMETTPVPYTADVAGSQPRDAPEERPVTPHSEVTSEGSVRRSENDTEDEEGMVLVGRPR